MEYLSGTAADFTLKHVCDVDSRRGAEAVELARKLFGYEPGYVKNMEDVFSDQDVDAVIIATPGHWNTLAAVKACRAGKDLYLEAMPCLSIGEGQKLLEVIKQYKCAVQVGFQHRSAAYCVSAKEYIASGRLGQVVHIKTYNLGGGRAGQSFTESALPEGLDWNLWLGPAPYREFSEGIHSAEGFEGWAKYWDYSEGRLGCYASQVLDMARMLVGDPEAPRSVYCYAGNWVFDSDQQVPEMQIVTYDYEAFTLTCETGLGTAYMLQSGPGKTSADQPGTAWQRMSNRIEVYGTEGLMNIGIDGSGWQVLGSEGNIIASDQGLKPDPEHLQNFIDKRKVRDGLNAPLYQSIQSALLIHMGNIAFRTGNSHLLFDSVKRRFIDNAPANDLINRVYRSGFEMPGKL